VDPLFTAGMPTVKPNHPHSGSESNPAVRNPPVPPASVRVVVELDEVGSSGGGKAAGLARLRAAGLPVPPTRVVPAEVLDMWLTDRGLHRGAPAERVRTALIEGSLPKAWGEALIAAGRALGPRLAVRSSGADEDGATRSLAGLFHTALGVEPEGVPDAVRAVWASAFGEAAVAGRGRASGMAVVLQAMIEPDAAGVLFTINPQNGSWREVVVEAVRGQGEALVSGRQAPQWWVVRRPRRLPAQRIWNRLTLRVAEEDRVPQEHTWGVGSNGELTRRPVPNDQRAVPLLARGELLHLCRLALRAELAAGEPLDVEWARVGSRITLLQARPITRVGAPRPRDVLWTRRFLGERWPTPPTPLSWSLLAPVIDWFIAYPDVQERYLGGGPAVRLIRGRPYLNATVFRHLLFKLPGAPAPGFMLELIPPDEVETWRRRFRVKADWAVYNAIFATTWRERRWERFAFDPFTNHLVWDEFHTRFLRELSALDGPTLGPRDAVGRVEAQQALVRDYLSVHVCSLLFANLWYQVLESALATWAPGSASRWMERLAVCPPGNKTLEANHALWELARAAGPGDLDALARRSPPSSGFQARLADFLREYGHRAESSWEIFSPRWAQRPDLLVPLLADPGLEAPRQRAGRQEQDFHAARLEVLAEVGGWRARVLDRLIFLTRRYLLLRENQRFAFDLLLAAMQRTLLALGATLPLDDAADVRWLAWDEARGLALGTLATAPPVASRRAEHAAACLDDPPIFLRGEDSADRITAGSRLDGLAVAPGRARGPVRVLRNVGDGAALKAGEILVAHALDPGWTALLPRAGGLVLELGSVLSHGSVIAREYGVPGVVNVTGATRRLRDGQEVTVDGGRGLVWLHD
jgi:phosphohistidine swiveling domain-containing protein